jgi:hypothetical protein
MKNTTVQTFVARIRTTTREDFFGLRANRFLFFCFGPPLFRFFFFGPFSVTRFFLFFRFFVPFLFLFLFLFCFFVFLFLFCCFFVLRCCFCVVDAAPIKETNQKNERKKERKKGAAKKRKEPIKKGRWRVVVCAAWRRGRSSRRGARARATSSTPTRRACLMRGTTNGGSRAPRAAKSTRAQCARN